MFGERLPPLAGWLARFALPSAAAIAATLAVLYWTQREALREPIAAAVPVPPLSRQAG